MKDNNTADFEEIFDSGIHDVYLSLSFTIILIGIILNAVVLWLYYKQKISHTLFNFCLVQLGISNIFQNIGAIPYMVVDLRKKKRIDWSNDSIRCGVVDGQSLFFNGAFVTIYIISFMSIKWYKIIKNPLNAIHHQKSPVKGIICLWIFAFLLMVPNYFTFFLDKYHGYCVRNHEEHVIDYIVTYKIALFLIGFITPVIVMTVTFLLIIRQFYVNTSMGQTLSPVKLKYRKKVVRFLGTVIGVFLFCWLPFAVYWVLDLTPVLDTQTVEDIYVNIRVLKWVMVPCFGAAILNVICYAWRDEEIRRQFFFVFQYAKNVCDRKFNGNEPNGDIAFHYNDKSDTPV